MIARDVEVRAQRPPYVTRVHAVLDGLSGGAPKSGQHMVDEQGRPARRSELPLDEFVEFRQPHPTKLRRGRERFMAHPYRIFDLGDTRAGSPCGFAVPRRRQHLADGSH
jgi:hypothetical protein